MCITTVNEFIFFWYALIREILQIRPMNNRGCFLRSHGKCHCQKNKKKDKCSNLKKTNKQQFDFYLVQCFSHQETSVYTHSTYILIIAYKSDFLFLTAGDLANSV